MPIQIKKDKLKPLDKRYRKSTVVCAVFSLIFLIAIFSLMGKISGNGGKLPVTVFFLTYISYAVSCIVTLVFGVRAYQKEDNFTDLFQCLFYTASIIFCIIIFRFMLCILLAGYGQNALVSSILGSMAHTQFFVSQFYSLIFVIIGILLTFILGVLSIVKLVKDK